MAKLTQIARWKKDIFHGWGPLLWFAANDLYGERLLRVYELNCQKDLENLFDVADDLAKGNVTVADLMALEELTSFRKIKTYYAGSAK